MKKKKIRNIHADHQIGVFDIKLCVGDRLYKNNELYGEVADVSETLYFIKRAGSDGIPNPYSKAHLIDNIVMGVLSIEHMNFE